MAGRADGGVDQSFLQIPQEVIRAPIRNNQKCFVLRDATHAKLVNQFLLVANLEAEDGGKAIVAGNERVIWARLSDGRFFYQTDLKTKLEDRLPSFTNIIFHGSWAARPSALNALNDWPANWHLSSAPTCKKQNARRDYVKPTC